ncbi:MAG: hypothetical protein PF513_01370 [Tenericutes bacterium]|nr:hypothetical protein [Mycoplasmatota bacterium]
MKKILLLIIILTFTLLGCQTKESISVIVPNGGPSIAQSYMEYNNDHDFIIDRVSGPQPLVAAFTSESHDIIIAPVNLGANLYQKGSPYQLAGILTWSNLQIISRTEINDIHDLEGKDVIAFGEGAIPEMIINYLFENIEFDQDINVLYDASSAQESFMSFMQDEDSIAIVSEPITSSARDMVNPLYILDLADIWSDYTDEGLFPLAGVFVHKDLSLNQVTSYLALLEESAVYANLNPSGVALICEELEYPFEKEIIEASIPMSNINLKGIDQSKSNIEDFMTMIYEFKPELIGNAIPDEEWYYPLS